MTLYAERLKEERRLVLLRCLSEAPNYTANESTLRTALEHYGFSVGRDTIRADLGFLVDHTLVRREVLNPPSGGELWLLHLLPAGEDVAKGRERHYGIARPDVA